MPHLLVLSIQPSYVNYTGTRYFPSRQHIYSLLYMLCFKQILYLHSACPIRPQAFLCYLGQTGNTFASCIHYHCPDWNHTAVHTLNTEQNNKYTTDIYILVLNSNEERSLIRARAWIQFYCPRIFSRGTGEQRLK